ncbi:unnamed protein product [Tuber melanosporum]|uniref:NADPH--cytochrome P450 reductase n=1 Tax=Tuber melanosporum (strain Mel28) TaxID=656061 RepID=D5G949_TUBMM|nr:uncharacterized protein GSTUM_00003136001 [Tuber melanosporum]CAZ81042.1 unnamed protein product [Tuber melanosporum]
MATQLDTLDVLVLAALLLGTIAYFTKGSLWAVEKDTITGIYGGSKANGAATKGSKTRDIVKTMEESDKNMVIFYGSQTGTAEDYASRLAKEGSARFGLKTMIANLEEFDYENLDTLPEDKVAVFVMATYGEGEPTDNAVDFYEFIMGDDVNFTEGDRLGNLKFIGFGLGNNTYEHFNAVIRRLTATLLKLGAKQIGNIGEGDDGTGTMEEDFLAWKEPMWKALQEEMDLEEREAVYEPVFSIAERTELSVEDDTVYLGEPNKNHLEGGSKGPYGANNPFIAPIKSSREIFTVKDRNCLHMEIDLTGTNLSYTTGDHIAVWPTNAGKEVDGFLKVLGLEEKKDGVIDVTGIDSTAKVPFPTPTTYDAIARYHLEICAPVSRQFLASLAAFAPTPTAKDELTRLGGDKDYFQETISSRYLNIAQVLELNAPGEIWSNVPFSLMVEGLNRIQPRYYSISSSSLVQPKLVSITCHGDPEPDPHGLSYAITGPRNKYDGIHVPVHTRASNFRLPSDPSKPVIMIGPGTGVAPFRAFVQERAALAEKGERIGKTLLFFGCRKASEDFLYQEEWKEYASKLGDSFSLITAFSRDGPEKVYVQHRLKERAKEVNELLAQGSYFYVCGDAAHMAREVNTSLGSIIAQERGLTETQGEEIVKRLRSSNLYQEDVWS